MSRITKLTAGLMALLMTTALASNGPAFGKGKKKKPAEAAAK